MPAQNEKQIKQRALSLQNNKGYTTEKVFLCLYMTVIFFPNVMQYVLCFLIKLLWLDKIICPFYLFFKD